MSSLRRQYLFALLFIGFGIYQLILKEYLEFSLYAVAGSAFFSNALTLEPRLTAHKKPLVIITWILIVAACILFLYLLQTKF